MHATLLTRVDGWTQGVSAAHASRISLAGWRARRSLPHATALAGAPLPACSAACSSADCSAIAPLTRRSAPLRSQLHSCTAAAVLLGAALPPYGWVGGWVGGSLSTCRVAWRRRRPPSSPRAPPRSRTRWW